ncbi:MAG: phage replisome organizer N-terminal domain-containing protein [Fibrobacter sp.]|uniref:phage replisome organizer N-terminal domain-containing protein n=1 Tax=Fibrobacter sp. TaxID=35828 RepID=UPI0025BEF013|nr:phage replisome organizer N-terminal domain-containing protein [Fibrobacter sp.]MBQ9226541.1 phage replisome organizer N-terminal domain-containing protein [Fibrobacter sp.]
MSEIYYYSKFYSDTFDSTAWRLIMNEPYPVPAYARLIYTTILAESTKAKGTLMRSADKAYTVDELMALCNIRRNDPQEVKDDWLLAYDALKREGIIEIDAKNVIRITLSDELFGSETEEARRSRARRQRKTSLEGEEAVEPRSNDGQMTESAHASDQDSASNGGESMVELPSNGIPPKLNVTFINPPKSQETREKAPTVDRPSDAAAEFLQIYPKKTDPSKIAPLLKSLSEEEFEALLLVAKRVSRDPSKTEAHGRFAMDPVKFVKSKPWTEDDLEAARSIIWGRRQSEALEGGEGDVE